MGPDLRQMRYVVAVARERNFTRAAEELHVAQQALSQQVRAVEEMLGVELFDRSKRPLEVTPAGALFVQEAKRTLSASTRAVERTRAAARGEVGSIRLAYTFTIAYETMPVLLDAVAQDTPGVKVVSREMFGGDIPFHIRDEKIDLALTPRTEPAEDLAAEAIRREPLIAALPERHPLASRRKVDLAELANDLFQVWPPVVSPGFHAAVMAACHTAGFEPELDDTGTGSTVWRNIADGRGVGLVVASVGPQLPRGIALVELASPDAHVILDAVWRRDAELPAVARFLETARRVRAEREWV